MNNSLVLKFDGTAPNRSTFLSTIRTAVMEYTGERMTLDALIQEIAKNIFDHAEGKGVLEIKRERDKFLFMIKDEGQESHDLKYLTNTSRLAGNGVNFGVGLKMIQEIAEGLGIDLKIDTSAGFTYSGVYTIRDD